MVPNVNGTCAAIAEMCVHAGDMPAFFIEDDIGADALACGGFANLGWHFGRFLS
jgi:hypothetical protein